MPQSYFGACFENGGFVLYSRREYLDKRLSKDPRGVKQFTVTAHTLDGAEYLARDIAMILRNDGQPYVRTKQKGKRTIKFSELKAQAFTNSDKL